MIQRHWRHYGMEGLEREMEEVDAEDFAPR